MELNNFPSALSYTKYVDPKFEKNKIKYNINYSIFNLSSGNESFIVNNEEYNIFAVRFAIIGIPGLTPNKYVTQSSNFAHILKNYSSHIGHGYMWGNWGIMQENPYFFVGKLDHETNKVILHHKIEYNKYFNFGNYASDCRIYLIRKINNIDNTLYLYIILPRQLSKMETQFILVRVDSFNNINCRLVRGPHIEIVDKEHNKSCFRDSDLNTPLFDIKISKHDENNDLFEMYFFRWYENNCITRAVIRFIFPNNDKFYEYDNFSIETNYDRTKSCTLFECTEDKEKLFRIKNDFYTGLNKPIDNKPAFSFGSSFIKLNDHQYLGVGHTKIYNLESFTTFEPTSKVYKVRNIVHKCLEQLYGNKYKMHISNRLKNKEWVFDGYIYSSYFMILDTQENTFKISDSFFTIDDNDEYHFSLLFTIGLFKSKINGNIYITSGEGDLYSSVIQFKLDDIIEACRHLPTSENFIPDNLNYYIIHKNKFGVINNFLINETVCENIKLSQSSLVGGYTNSYYAKKYFKYKNKYTHLKYK